MINKTSMRIANVITVRKNANAVRKIHKKDSDQIDHVDMRDIYECWRINITTSEI